MSDAHDKQNDPEVEEPPPFGSWNHWYAAVLVLLAILMAVFYLFTRLYSEGA